MLERTKTASGQTARNPERPATDASNATNEAVVPVAEERLDVGTRRIETDSGIRVHKTVDERVQLIDEPLTKDELSVERVPVDRYVDEPVSVRYEGDTMVVPVLEEVLVVEKRLLLKEEVRITRRTQEYRNPQRVTLRREHAEVEHFGDAADAADPALDGPATSNAAYDGSSLFERRRSNEARQRHELAAPHAEVGRVTDSGEDPTDTSAR